MENPGCRFPLRVEMVDGGYRIMETRPVEEDEVEIELDFEDTGMPGLIGYSNVIDIPGLGPVSSEVFESALSFMARAHKILR